jgi:lipopolysaccharide export system permease protein
MMTPKDFDWLHAQSCFFVTNIDYEALRGGNSWQNYASTLEIISRLKAERGTKSGNDLRVSIHQRLTRPAIDWTVLLLGIPVLLSRPDRHMFWVAGVSLAIVSSFTAVVMGLAAAGSSGYLISPLLATWLPLILFLPWAWAKTLQAMET